MPNYKYRAVDSTGKTYQGTLRTPSEKDLFHCLREHNHVLLSSRKQLQLSFLKRSVLSRRDLIEFCLHMSQMTRVGVPLLEALADLRESHPRTGFRDVVGEIHQNIESGQLFSQALAKYPEVFDRFFVHILQTYEKTGELYQGFDKLIVHLKWIDEAQSKLIKALRYPLLVGIIVILALSILFITLIPQLKVFLCSLGVPLPPFTKLLISLSHLIQFLIPCILGGLFVGTMSVIIARKFSSQAVYFLDQSLYLLPIMRSLGKTAALLRFIHCLFITFSAGISLMECLELSENMIENQFLRTSLKSLREQVGSGLSLSQAMSCSGIFPKEISRMIKIGESTGTLDRILENLTSFLEIEVKNRTNTLIDFIEPSLILFMGVMMGWIVFAMFYPIYDHLTALDYM